MHGRKSQNREFAAGQWLERYRLVVFHPLRTGRGGQRLSLTNEAMVALTTNEECTGLMRVRRVSKQKVIGESIRTHHSIRAEPEREGSSSGKRSFRQEWNAYWGKNGNQLPPCVLDFFGQDVIKAKKDAGHTKTMTSKKADLKDETDGWVLVPLDLDKLQ